MQICLSLKSSGREDKQNSKGSCKLFGWSLGRYYIPEDDFDMDHQIICKLERDKILEIDNNLDLKFKKIIDPTSLDKNFTKY